MIFRVKIETNNFTPTQAVMIYKAGQLVEECLNTSMFQTFCLNHTADGSMGGVPGFHYTAESGEKIHTKIMSGAEVLEPSADNEADIFIELDRSMSWSAIGYTYPNTKWQYIYNRFFSGASVAAIAGNIAHEYMHKLGFEHEFKYTKLREFSVPYAVGYFVERYAKKAHQSGYFERFKAYFA